MQTSWRRCRDLTFAALIATIAVPSPAKAQAALTAFLGWQWGGTLEFPNGDVHINAAPSYGAAFTMRIHEGYGAELMYSYQGSEVFARPNSGADFKMFDLGTHYAQVNGIKRFGDDEARLIPFLFGGLGTTVLVPGSSSVGNFETEWLISISMGAGVLVPISERAALRVQSRFLLAANPAGAGYYFGTGGSQFIVSGSTAIPQGDVSVGVTIPLGP